MHEVVRLYKQPSEVIFAYGDDLSIEQKIETIVRKQKNRHTKLTELGFAALPICMVKNITAFQISPFYWMRLAIFPLR